MILAGQLPVPLICAVSSPPQLLPLEVVERHATAQVYWATGASKGTAEESEFV
jgi:hypothetical protein